MKTAEIIKNISENGGFDNFNRWNRKEICEYVKANFQCSNYVAKQVSFRLS